MPIQVRTYFVKTDDDSYRAALQLTELDPALRRQELAHSLTATPQFLLDKICVASLRNR